MKLGRREQFKNLEVEILRGSWSECEPESAKYSFRPSNWSVLALVRFRLLVNMGLQAATSDVQLRDLQLRQTAAFNYQLPTSAMSADTNKENIADGLLAPLEDTSVGTRKAKKSRSLSAGPGSLNVPLKEESGNRRKV